MKAKIKPRIELSNRTRLEEVIPLSTPYLVFLDPSDVCNFQCKFCPTGDRALIRSIRRPQLMPFDLYVGIIDDLASMPEPIKTLRMYSDGEPLLNRHLPAMVKYAKDSGRILSVDTTTNGSLFTPRLNNRLINAGLDKIFISVNGLSDTDFWNFAKYKIRFNQYVKGIRHFYNHRGNCKMTIKIAGDLFGPSDLARFYEIFGNICDNIFVEHTANCWPHFNVPNVNQEVGIYGQPLADVQVCPYIFYSMKINSDGTVSQCFLDWPHTNLIGDLVRTRNFSKIWNGAKLKRLRIKMLKGNRHKIPFCANCGQLSCGAPDNIDAYAKQLLERLK